MFRFSRPAFRESPPKSGMNGLRSSRGSIFTTDGNHLLISLKILFISWDEIKRRNSSAVSSYFVPRVSLNPTSVIEFGRGAADQVSASPCSVDSLRNGDLAIKIKLILQTCGINNMNDDF